MNDDIIEKLEHVRDLVEGIRIAANSDDDLAGHAILAVSHTVIHEIDAIRRMLELIPAG
jgi:hypothetical protein